MNDYRYYLQMVVNAGYDFRDIIDVSSNDWTKHKFIAIKDKMNDVIYVAQFSLNGKFEELYTDDNCHSLQDFQFLNEQDFDDQM